MEHKVGYRGTGTWGDDDDEPRAPGQRRGAVRFIVVVQGLLQRPAAKPGGMHNGDAIVSVHD